MRPPTAVMIGVGITVILALWTDIRKGTISNRLTMTSMACGCFFNAAWGLGITGGLAGLGAGLGVFLIPFIMGGVGGGDVKLFGALGAWLGWRGVLLTALLSTVMGGVIALGVTWKNAGWTGALTRTYMSISMRKISALGATGSIPYTPAVLMGLSVYLVWSCS